MGPQGPPGALGFLRGPSGVPQTPYSILMKGGDNLRLQPPFPKSKERPDTPFFSVESFS